MKFWYRRGILAWLLWPASFFFSVAVVMRKLLYKGRIFKSAHPGIPVPFRSTEQLAGELRRAAAPLNEPVVVISADAAATHQAVVRVMEAARAAGLSQITFTTQSSK